ncbi:MAG: response regulator transcription factor [Acidobacteriaceae bacterium]
MRILVVEDELRMMELLRKGLQEQGHTVTTCRDGTAAAELAIEHPFDVIVLDIGLPGMNGYHVAQILRSRNTHASILMLTARDREDDIIRGLNLGADDYVTKPFSFPELLARIHSLNRPALDSSPTSFQVENLIVDIARHTAARDGKQLHLTRQEFLLLQQLVEQAPAIVSRKVLTERIWGAERTPGRGAFDILLHSLRNKIDTPFQRAFIHTVRGRGYYVGTKPQE